MSKKFMDKDDKGIHPIQKAQQLTVKFEGQYFHIEEKEKSKNGLLYLFKMVFNFKIS